MWWVFYARIQSTITVIWLKFSSHTESSFYPQHKLVIYSMMFYMKNVDENR